MSVVEDLASFLNSSGQNFRIEVEGKPDKMRRFLRQYNADHGTNLDLEDDGVTTLGDVDKWDLEFRLYLNDISGVPNEVNVTRNRAYQGQYAYRISRNSLIRSLLDEYGFNIGDN